MKKTLLLSICLLLRFVGFSQNTFQGLVVHYMFNGNTLDNGPNSLNGIGTNITYGSNESGQPNTAAYFNGTTSNVVVGYNPLFDLDTAITIIAKMKPTGFYTGPCQANMICSNWINNTGYSAMFSDQPYDFNCNTIDTNQFTFSGRTALNNSWQNLINYNFKIHTGHWYCVTFVQANPLSENIC